MGQGGKYFIDCGCLPRPIIVPHPNHRDRPPLQALTPRELCSRFLITSPSEPLSRLGKGGGGKGQMRLRLPWERFCAQYGLIFGSRRKINPYPAQPATGVLGRSPKRVLVPFTRVKGTPRRRAVLTKFSKRLAPPQAISRYNLTGRGGWGAGLIFAEECPAAGRRKVPQSSCFVRLCSGRFCTIIE